MWKKDCKIDETELSLEKFVNNIIQKYNYNLNRFNYNVLIASLYETYNFFSEIDSTLYIAYDIDNVNTLTILAKANFINFLACIIFLNYDFK